MHTCKYCNKEFETAQQMGGHVYRCSLNPEASRIYTCDFCGKELKGKHSFSKHVNHCELNPNHKIHNYNYAAIEKLKNANEEHICPHCSASCNNILSYKAHVRHCPQNPERILSNIELTKDTRKSWNKGLTEDMDERVAKCAQASRNYYASHSSPFLGKHHTNDAKERIARAQLELEHTIGAGHFGKCGWYDGIYFMSTWELAYYIHQRDTNHSISRCTQRFRYEWEGKQHNYTPDFVCDGKIIEIKGFESDLDRFKYTLVPNLVILKEKDIQESIQFVKTNYDVDRLETLYIDSKW